MKDERKRYLLGVTLPYFIMQDTMFVCFGTWGEQGRVKVRTDLEQIFLWDVICYIESIVFFFFFSSSSLSQASWVSVWMGKGKGKYIILDE
jgi:hypothetical protein